MLINYDFFKTSLNAIKEKINDVLNLHSDWNVSDKNDPRYIENRTHYEEDRVRVMIEDGVYLYKVSDEVPESLTDLEVTVWLSTPDGIIHQSIEYDSIKPAVVVSYTDNYEIDGIVFPEKGVYFLSVNSNEFYTTGVEWGTTGTPDITWDGSATDVHQIDSKYIPSHTDEEVIALLQKKLDLTLVTDAIGNYYVANGNYIVM